ncbi:Ribosome-releasing factor 2, mitochondrial [Linderina macrospora]|uniref:Ribosome-releasing factor 2, mitochondrial n=1 Tax=Linderina macrospora TaxID=4868 RepID=A0ACC1JFA7_9FUNG|nr:Ribosome-releasing factor 2, mitochondrial [Linderina macrospora]
MALRMSRAIAHRTAASRSLHHMLLRTSSFRNARAYTSHRSDPLDKVRNIGIIAHIDAGKTTTTERMLHYAGFTRSIGDVDDGDTVMDYLPAERERGITIQSAAITFGWNNCQLHLIDTPGHVDFTVEVERAMRVLDGAVTILDAVAGVQAQTLTVWRQATRYKIPRIIFVNKMDRDGANWRKCIDDIGSKLETRPLVLQVPESEMARLEGRGLERWVDAVTMERIEFDIEADNTGSTVRRSGIAEDDPMFEKMADARTQLVETLAEIDQQIVDVFLSDAVDGNHLKVPVKDIKDAIRRVTQSSQACPVLLGASFRNVGVQPLLDAVLEYLPSPTKIAQPTMAVVPGQKGKKSTEIVRLDGSQLVAFAFKVIVDAQRGPMVFVRVYSGTLDSRMTLVNGTQGGVKERATKLLQMYADQPEEIPAIHAGHIGVVLGLKMTKTGDTLLHAQHPSLPKSLKAAKKNRSVHTTKSDPVGWQLHGISVPPPVFFCAVEADSPQDERPLADALANLTLEDPSLHVSHDEETGQTLLSGMGELHLEVIQDRMIKDMKINATFGKMRVSYRETAGQSATAQYTYVREIAGKHGKAALRVSVEPIIDPETDDNVIEVNMPDHLVVPGEAAPVHARDDDRELRDTVRTAIHEGITNAAFRGTVLGFPVTRTRITVTDVEYFGEDLSTLSAYRACAGQALAQALGGCSPVLLEPIAKTAIACPEKHVGSVLSDLNGARRGRVISLDDAEEGVGAGKLLVAEMPLSTMVGYSSMLRSLTAGAGSFTMEVVGFGQMTMQQQQSVIKESRGY